MFNILVTGSKGFIGKNLLKKLKKLNKISGIHILEYNRGDSSEVLEKLLIKSDFIFHLAGEVRPDSSDKNFKKSNVSLTKEMIEILKKNKIRVPILLASTIHAVLLKNEYGKTKRDSELLVEEYSIKYNINSFIYRLPHVFGEGCKINYNSVISTWIYNSITDKEIVVYDRNIKICYAYVQDIIEDFLYSLNNQKKLKLYLEPKQMFETTLGEVVDFISEFKQNVLMNNYEVENNSFKQKLFQTYKDYYRSLDEK
ncbi:NAD-dependent epimerase/dehydratase family protein [Candidatus Sulfurimonas marisnigri]|uniref:NAD-dependent epimerase/dehydratase family protein n=1 Tax=Candidatus Sulfurimonas marisnigri TaxID=2740405 RepID=A0A7S7RQ14_9BACT|nr:NAD-dependent epimerase/dehydratase family protein [Candidatus Sulfurimonas marisnigri]QOY54073.1 NAD-dependent epimerase/dehydratase family protein [Candidatus Sulfurimonas marisnigri]